MTIWLEVTLAAAGGAVAGWLTHAFVRRRVRTIDENSRETRTVSSPPAPNQAAPAATAEKPVRPPLSEGADTAGRVILHLWSLGRLDANSVAPLGFTQRGITRALGIRQGNLTKVMSRLEAAGVVQVDSRHVEGESRRLKIYRLTALGESVARDVRRRRK